MLSSREKQLFIVPSEAVSCHPTRGEVITLGQAFADYLSLRDLRPKSFYDHKGKINRHLKDWLDMDLRDISKAMVEERHRKISQHAHVQANHVFKILRAIYNLAKYKYETATGGRLIERNPVDRLTEIGAWNTEYPSTRMIPTHRIKDLMHTLLLMSNTTIRDYLLLLLFTGLRSSEAMTLRWDCVDMSGRFFVAQDTKNGKPHTLPMSDFVYELFLERTRWRRGAYVFPRRGGKVDLPLSSPHKQVERIAIDLGIKFSPHDLRRTFLAIAEDCKIDEHTRKRLLNHTFTDTHNKHYSIPNPERLREPMSLISSRILKLAELPFVEEQLLIG